MNKIFKEIAIQHQWKEYYSRVFFSLSAIRELCTYLDIDTDNPLYKELEPIHCIHWVDLGDEGNQEVIRILKAMFGDDYRSWEDMS